MEKGRIRRRTIWMVALVAGGGLALFLLISGALFMGQDRQEWETRDGRAGLFSPARGTVGVLEVKGPIMESKVFLEHLRGFERNPRVQALVLRINSPGGAVAPSQEMYQALKDFSKPIVASMGSVAASGGYYIACGADQVFANPGTITGSIGVIIQLTNLTGLFDWAGIKPYSVKTGEFKDAGAPYREMTGTELELFQVMLDDVLGQFKEAVQEGRGLSEEEVAAVADGRIMSGRQAHERGLVDTLGGFREAVMAAAELAGIEDEPVLLYPKPERQTLLDLLLGFSGDGEAQRGGVLGFLIQAVIGQQAYQAMNSQLPAGVYWLWNPNYDVK
jgi:protease IV